MQYFLIVLLVMVLPDLYIWSFFVRGGNVWWSILYWGPLAVTLLCIGGFLAGYHPASLLQPLFILLLCISLPKLLFVLIALTGKGFGFVWPYAVPLCNTVGMITAVVVFGSTLYGFTRGWKRLTVKEISISSAQLRHGLRRGLIGTNMQIRQLHQGVSVKGVRELVQRVNELNPDAVVFTGDLVNLSPNELDPFMEILSQFKAKDGVFSILGNHDYCKYMRYDTPDGQQKSLEEVIRREGQLGWQLLLNEHRIIRRGADSIALIGVENDGKPPFPSLADLPKATRGLAPDSYKILLSHDPSHWRRTVLPTTDIQLTLSGHTHAMQLKLGNFSPSKWMYPEWGGTYTETDRALHVSTGTGSNFAFRIGAWPEITVIRLLRNPAS